MCVIIRWWITRCSGKSWHLMLVVSRLVRLAMQYRKLWRLWKLQAAVHDAGTKQFGSGWVWLVRTSDGKIEITSTPNQDNPMTSGHFPLWGMMSGNTLTISSIRTNALEYLKQWWNVVNWDEINKRFEMASRAIVRTDNKKQPRF